MKYVQFKFKKCNFIFHNGYNYYTKGNLHTYKYNMEIKLLITYLSLAFYI